MKKFTFTALFFLILALHAHSQKGFHLGITTGYNYTWLMDAKMNSEGSSFKTTPTYKFAPVGALLGYHFTNNVGIQAEAIYSQQGQYWDYKENGNTIAQYNVDLSYIHLPIAVTAKTSGRYVKVNFVFGPQFSFLAKGTDAISYKDASRNYSNRTFASTSSANMDANGRPVFGFNTFDIELMMGIGANIRLVKNLYGSVMLRGNYGFLDIHDKDYKLFLQRQPNSEYLPGNYLQGFDNRTNALVGVQLGLVYVLKEE